LIIALALVVFLGSRKEPVITVQVEKYSTATDPGRHGDGKIQPEVQVKITPEVSGEIVALPVKEGIG
jgi:HlyD family secretion protein